MSTEMSVLQAALSGADVRARRPLPLSFALLTVVLPVAVVASALLVVDAVGINQLYMDVITKSILEYRAWTPVDAAQVAILDLNGKLRFAAAQTLLIATAYIAGVTALLMAGMVVRDHGGMEGEIRYFIFFIFGASCIFALVWISFGLTWIPGIKVRDFFIYLVPEMLQRSSFERSGELVRHIELRGGYGGAVGLAAAACLVGATAIIAYRWRKPRWAEPSVLRRQMGCLLALFAIASILLVVSNAAVRSLLDWPVGLLPGPDADPTTVSLLESARGMAGAMSYWWSVLSTAVLLTTFIPAFISLMFDINLAACDHLRSVPVESGAEHTEPTAKQVRDWKEQNGLLLSGSEMVTAGIAAAAPLLTAPIIDLTKSIVVPS